MRILFIGNSYTYYNDMPSVFTALAEENGKTVQVDAVTKGGRKLYENLAEGDEYHDRIVSLCAEHPYDVLVLQEQSWLALADYEAFARGIRGLVHLVSAKRSIFYATWGRKAGSELLLEYDMTTEEMTARLECAYQKEADACGAELSPVGRCFLHVSEAIPALDLYNPDRSHPSYAGSCVAALTHYVRIFGEAPMRLSALQLDEELLRTILPVIEGTVL